VKRRTFIWAMGSSLASPLVIRRVAAQPPPTRAAVVIGVNKAGDLPVLKAAASGARAIQQWLHSEGFKVYAFIDDIEPIHAHAVQKQIAELIDPGTLEQLVIYFAGHGFLNAGSSEIWLLSEAPANSSEAINVEAGILASRESGTKNVIFISDTCRSTPDSLRSSRVQGYDVFPNLDVARPRRPDIDRFFATQPGRRAEEVPVSESAQEFEGIYTTTFMDAFKATNDEMVRTVDGIKVVPNRMLKAYLATEVPRRAQARSIRLNQKPESIVESDEQVYIGRAHAPIVVEREPSPPTDVSSLITFGQVADVWLRNVGLDLLSRPLVIPADAIFSSSQNADFQKTRKQILGPLESLSEFFVSNVTVLMPRSAIIISHTEIDAVFSNPRIKSEISKSPDLPGMKVIGVDTSGLPACSVAISFADGGGVVVAGLKDFWAMVVIEGGRVLNVSYVPSRENYRWADYGSQVERISELRATVAASAEFGAFRIEGDRESRTSKSRELADNIRVGKGLDPTLGVYAAYAYADADVLEQVRSVRDYMHGDLGIDLFDVAMLASGPSRPFPREHIVPFCPMLSQGWNLLRVKGVELPFAVQRARDHIRPALWTTFDREGLAFLADALLSGQLT
jgi:hypothetical protein